MHLWQEHTGSQHKWAKLCNSILAMVQRWLASGGFFFKNRMARPRLERIIYGIWSQSEAVNQLILVPHSLDGTESMCNHSEAQAYFHSAWAKHTRCESKMRQCNMTRMSYTWEGAGFPVFSQLSTKLLGNIKMPPPLNSTFIWEDQQSY